MLVLDTVLMLKKYVLIKCFIFNTFFIYVKVEF